MIVLLLFLSLCSLASSQVQTRACRQNSKCIRLPQCPTLLNKAHSPNPTDRLSVRQAFCGFQSGIMLVCCSTAPSALSKPVAKSGTGTNPNGERLLPRNCGHPKTEDRIFGGKETAIGAYPWMVALGYSGKAEVNFACGGALINKRYVLTAAHCINPPDIGGEEIVAIHIGDWDVKNDGIDCQTTRFGKNCAKGPALKVGFEELLMHPDYSKRFIYSDDIALIRLDKDVNFDTVDAQPVCLPPQNFDITTKGLNRLPIVTGWGDTEHGRASNILLSVQVPFQPDSKCIEHYTSRVYGSNQICAGGEDGKDSCAGDSGGPMIMSGPAGPPFLQVGIVSAGGRCGVKGQPAIYTSVSKYRSWITNNMKP